MGEKEQTRRHVDPDAGKNEAAGGMCDTGSDCAGAQGVLQACYTHRSPDPDWMEARVARMVRNLRQGRSR
jgi:hypothetical protein